MNRYLIGCLVIVTGLLLMLMAFNLGVWASGAQTELVINGDMESDEGWAFPVTAAQGGYSEEQFISPTRSARLGIVTGPNAYAYSSMNQSIVLPPLASGEALMLSWYAYLLSQPLDANDLQYVQIQDKYGVRHTIWFDRRHTAPNWLFCRFDVSAYAGQTIVLYFGVKNNGLGGITAMYVDDVSLGVLAESQLPSEGCEIIEATPSPTPTATPTGTAPPTATPTPTLTPTPTPTPSPTPSPTPTATPTATPPPATPSCAQLVQNPEFDAGYQGWTQNLYLTATYQDALGESHTGAWFGGAEYIDQFLYQDVTLPVDGDSIRLSFLWAFDPAEGMGTGDALTLTLQSPDGTLLQPLLTIERDSISHRWQSANFPLNAFRGQRIRIHARATTHATTPSWYLDQVQILTCALDRQTFLPWMLSNRINTLLTR